MNLSCLICGGLFLEWDAVECDGCQRITHRETCGSYERVLRDLKVTVYYFCRTCMEETEDLQ